MAGLVPAIHVLFLTPKTWMPGIKPGMTAYNIAANYAIGIMA
jgi:hypothetical protein